MQEENIGTYTDKNGHVIVGGDIFTYLDSQWMAIFDGKSAIWIGHPIGSNLATEDLRLAEVHNDVEVVV